MHKVLPMNNAQNFAIRALNDDDPAVIAAAFARIGWNKPEAQYRRYLSEQAAGARTCLVALVDGQFAGYVTVNWRPSYPGFSELNIPEIQDLNILSQFRRQGVASHLLDHAEAEVARHFAVVGIGVGLHPGYNAAQRLYVMRGYIPDGRGVTYRDRYIEEGSQVLLDDDLVLHLTKQLRPDERQSAS
jgi:GNAT superfamily N-acetyltransferase